VEAAAAVVLRPQALLSTVHAAESPVLALPGSRASALGDAQRAAVRGGGPACLQLPVLTTERHGTVLVLDRVAREADAQLAHRAVVHGEDLLGFIAPTCPGDYLRVRLLTWRSPRPQPAPRWAAVARSQINPDLPHLSLLVAAAPMGSPFLLRVVRAVPRQLDTWSAGRWPYIARTAASPVLHPDLPAGLVLGRVEDVGYRDRRFVLRRYVMPRWDARGVVRVGVIASAPASVEAADHRRGGNAARVVWSSATNESPRRYLLRGTELAAGAAVFDGLHCLGRIRWACGGLAMATPLSGHGPVVPLVCFDGHDAPTAILVRGRGRGFAVVWPPEVEGEPGHSLFTGVAGSAFPQGLEVGRVRELGGGRLVADLFGDTSWPERVTVGGGVVDR
jgi:hypothetical protein